MSEPINCLVLDLSHYDTVTDWKAIKAAGVAGVIYKATQGLDWTDPTYKTSRQAAKDVGLAWGSYHFGDNSDFQGQATNYLSFAQPAADELIALDFEPSDPDTMGLEMARSFIGAVESGLNRAGQMVFYSGSLIKDLLGTKKDPFFGSRRLWLAQYGTSPVIPASWTNYWLWQYSGDGQGPTPHGCPGISGDCDCNSYLGNSGQLLAQWATGQALTPPSPPPPPTPDQIVTVTINAPAGVTVNVVQQPC